MTFLCDIHSKDLRSLQEMLEQLIDHQNSHSPECKKTCRKKQNELSQSEKIKKRMRTSL